MTNDKWPPRVSDRPAVVDAYANVLVWRLLVNGAEVRAGSAVELLDGDPAAVLVTPCAGFDLVVTPYRLGIDALLLLERADLHVPCVLRTGRAQQAAFLVRPATGRPLAGVGFVRVEAGPGAVLTLPPSPGARWDTPPWHRTRPEPLPLLDAMDLVPAFAQVERTCRGLPLG